MLPYLYVGPMTWDGTRCISPRGNDDKSLKRIQQTSQSHFSGPKRMSFPYIQSLKGDYANWGLHCKGSLGKLGQIGC